MKPTAQGPSAAAPVLAADTAIAPPIPSGDQIIRAGKRHWARWLGSLISLAVLVAALSQWQQLDFATLRTLLPTSFAFWIAFVVYYMLGPVSEWLIFRRLWQLPPAGIVPLLRKKVSNELVLGYLGEVYFYSWARRHGNLTAAPFGAIKDVAILSAMAGNAITLVMMAVGFPLLYGLADGLDLDLSQRTLAFSVAFMAVSSIMVLALRRRVLSLPREELVFVLAMHSIRIVAGAGVLALMWHLALPQVGLVWWVLLSLLRQLVTRLPFVANKDVVFASMAIFFVGGETMIPALMALVAGLVLVMHLAVAAGTGIYALVEKEGES